MVIYGVALLAGCMIAGVFCGELLGELIGVQANVGGVGIAMLLLVLVSDYLIRNGKLEPVSRQGIVFWSSIYIPVVVAMAASQNVLAAVEGGPAALVPVVSRLGRPTKPDPAKAAPEEKL